MWRLWEPDTAQDESEPRPDLLGLQRQGEAGPQSHSPPPQAWLQPAAAMGRLALSCPPARASGPCPQACRAADARLSLEGLTMAGLLRLPCSAPPWAASLRPAGSVVALTLRTAGGLGEGRGASGRCP